MRTILVYTDGLALGRVTREAGPIPMTFLSDLPAGLDATVVAVEAHSPSADALLLQRLADLGFIAGEPVRVLRRGPGGREPLAVQIGETLFGLRLHEARCVRVQPV